MCLAVRFSPDFREKKTNLVSSDECEPKDGGHPNGYGGQRGLSIGVSICCAALLLSPPLIFQGRVIADH